MLLLCLAVGLLAALIPGLARAQAFELRQAERIVGEEVHVVSLPDTLHRPAGTAPPLVARYRVAIELEDPPARLAICMPGLVAHARIRFNDHVIDDRMEDAIAPLPRVLGRIRLIEVPSEFVVRGRNRIEIEAAGPDSISVSQMYVGPRAQLGMRYEHRVMGAVIGPAIVSVAVGSLALCLLLLWVRRRDSLYGYFGLGTFGWALHDAWSVLPFSLLSGIHRLVWWTSLYGFFVAMLVIFCVRFAGWRWPRFDRVLVVAALSGPLLLYAAEWADVADTASEIWLMGWICVVAVGLLAVGRYAWTQRNANGALLLFSGGVSLAFGIRDWMLAHSGTDNNPIYLVPYAALMFVVLVAWMLIDRFVGAANELEVMNVQLEQRVSAKGAQLVSALEQMRLAKESAEAANRAKSSFLAAASHDLRQPIHALGLYMAALVDDSLNREQSDLVLRMKASLSALETMFNALLDVSRMDAGAVVPQVRVFSLEGMLHRLAEELAPRAAARGLRLSVRVAKAPRDLHALSDPMLVERIVLNLLGNAVKYTVAGGVLLSCRLRGGTTGIWRVEVWDTGPGIAEGDRQRVFEEFYQVGNLERDRAGGLGLGLSIVRRLSDLLGHRLELFSAPGRGTRFVLEIPCTADAVQVVTHDSVRPPRVILGLSVAVVDDDPEVRDSMRLLLQRWGFEVHAGADAAEILSALSRDQRLGLQAIIADYRLRQGRTGIEAIQALRTACGRALPALIVSGDSSPQPLERMQASGFDRLGKPVPPDMLHRWLAGITRNAEGIPLDTTTQAFDEAKR